jgi:hypothetical protein
MTNKYYLVEWIDRLEKSQDPNCKKLYKELKGDSEGTIMLCDEFFREMEKDLYEKLSEVEDWQPFDKYLKRVKSFKLTVDKFFPTYFTDCNMYEVCDKTEYYKLIRHVIDAVRE